MINECRQVRLLNIDAAGESVLVLPADQSEYAVL